jgi:hypothetical protein
MAALTWRTVDTPSFAGINQGYRGSSATLDRALTGLSEGLKQFSTDQQVGVDNSILARALQIQDPAQLRKELASGSLLQGVDLTRVNPEVLKTLDNRVGSLLNQASTEQGISSSKTSQAATQQSIDHGVYDHTRQVNEDSIEDAARPEQARSLGLTGALANLPTSEQRAVATNASNLVSAGLSQQGQRISNATGSYNLNTKQRDDRDDREAVNAVGGLLQRNATIDDLRRGYEETKFETPQAQQAALSYLEKAVGQRLYAPVELGGAPAAASGKPGNAPVGSGGGDVQSTDAKLALQEVGRRVSQNNSVGVVADIEKNLGDTRSAPEIAMEISKNFPEADQGKINGMISKAMSKYPDLSPADIGSAINRSTTPNWLGSTGVADGVSIDDSSFDANLKALKTGKADYMSADNQRTRAAGNVIKSADKSLADAKADLILLQRRAQSQTSIDTSKAEERVERAQKNLDEAIQRQQSNPAFKPIRPPEDRKKPISNKERFSDKNSYRNQ